MHVIWQILTHLTVKFTAGVGRSLPDRGVPASVLPLWQFHCMETHLLSLEMQMVCVEVKWLVENSALKIPLLNSVWTITRVLSIFRVALSMFVQPLVVALVWLRCSTNSHPDPISKNQCGSSIANKKSSHCSFSLGQVLFNHLQENSSLHPSSRQQINMLAHVPDQLSVHFTNGPELDTSYQRMEASYAQKHLHWPTIHCICQSY